MARTFTLRIVVDRRAEREDQQRHEVVAALRHVSQVVGSSVVEQAYVKDSDGKVIGSFAFEG